MNTQIKKINIYSMHSDDSPIPYHKTAWLFGLLSLVFALLLGLVLLIPEYFSIKIDPLLVSTICTLTGSVIAGKIIVPQLHKKVKRLLTKREFRWLVCYSTLTTLIIILPFLFVLLFSVMVTHAGFKLAPFIIIYFVTAGLSFLIYFACTWSSYKFNYKALIKTQKFLATN